MSDNHRETPASELITPSTALQTEFVLPEVPQSAEATAAKDDTPIERLGFRVGDIGLLYPDAIGREVVERPPASVLPNTPDWLCGIANVRGNMVPVVDLAMALRIERDKAQSPYLLVTGRGGEVVGVLIDGLPEPRLLQPQERLSGIPPHPELLKGHVHAAYERTGTVWFDVDYNGFFQTLTKRVGTA